MGNVKPLKITLTWKNGKLRISVREKRKGKFEDRDRPLTSDDLAVFKKGSKAAGMLAKGISDLRDIERIVNAPKSPGAHRLKAQPTHGAKAVGGRADRHLNRQ